MGALFYSTHLNLRFSQVFVSDGMRLYFFAACHQERALLTSVMAAMSRLCLSASVSTGAGSSASPGAAAASLASQRAFSIGLNV
jgi:hypothetical protein